VQRPSPFHHPVADLLGKTGEHRDIEVAGPIELTTDSACVAGIVRLSGRLDAMPDGLVSTGHIVYQADLTCNRCLTEWADERTVAFSQVFGPMQDEDVLPIHENGVIDLEPVVHDEVALDLPLAPLCRSDCQGLCPVCGSDLNTAPCSGHTDEPDHPFAALRQLLDPQDT
jgi:uncharacterized protein